MDRLKLSLIDEELESSEVAALCFLCRDVVNKKRLEGITDAKKLFVRLEEKGLLDNHFFLRQLLETIRRTDLLNLLETDSRRAEETDAYPVLSAYRVMLYRVYEDMTQENLEKMKFLLSNKMGRGQTEACDTALDVFAEMEKKSLLSDTNLDELHAVLLELDQQLALTVQHHKEGRTQQHQTPIPSHASMENQRVNSTRQPPQPVSETQPSYEGSICADAEPGTQSPSLLDPNEYYVLTHNPRGLCVVFNNEDFPGTDLGKRRGTQEDAKALSTVFTRLGFTVVVHDNLTAEAMKLQLQRLGSRNFLDDDALVVCVLSHGLKGYVFGSDEQPVYLHELKQPFTGAAAPTLAGKPKLFFVQACQGEGYQKGSVPCPPRPQQEEWDRQPPLEEDAGPVRGETVPLEADFLLGMATVPECKSFRHVDKGSIYIQELCTQLIRAAKSTWVTIVTRSKQSTHNKVAEHGEPSPTEPPELFPPPSHFKSKAWSLFGFYKQQGTGELDMKKAVCKVCRSQIAYCGNTTNMTAHIARHHPEKKNELENAKQRPLAQLRIDSTLHKLPAGSDKATRVTTAIAHFICKDLRPYSVVENIGFRYMIHTLEPRYVIPSRKFFTTSAIPKLYSETKVIIKQNLERANKIALTTDAWTSRATASYVTFSAHFIHDWTMNSYVLQTTVTHEAHTGVNMADLLQKVVTEWGMAGKVAAIVTDNASNMIVAVNLAAFTHIRCYAHTINLASQRGLKLPAVARLLGRVRRVTGFFHRSTTALHILEEKQGLLGLPAHRLITDVPTRWNSAFEMVERFLQQQPAITAALLTPEVREKEKDVCTFSEEDISHAEEFVEALKPVKVATCVMSDENHPTLSVIAPLHAQLLQMTVAGEGDSPFVKELKNAIHEDLSKRYSSEAEKLILNLTSALDPRFKELPFLSDIDKKDTLAKLVVEAAGTMEHRRDDQEQEKDEMLHQEGDGGPVPDGETEEPQHSLPAKQRRESCALAELLGSTFGETRHSRQMSPLDAAQKEVNEYTTAAPLPLSENPLDWWKVHHHQYPLLAQLAQQYLCVPGTSVSAERVFSTAGDIVSAQRSTLTPEHVDQLLFLHKNLNTPKCSQNDDILAVLTRVNREVSRRDYLTHKQMPEPKYTLTKKLVLKLV